MRVVELAKRIGIKSQDLRHELALVDYGIKPTDKEVPDIIAQGIFRVLARKYNTPAQHEELFPTVDESEEKEITEEKEEGNEENKESEESTNSAEEDNQENEDNEEVSTNDDSQKKSSKVVQTIDSIRFLKPAKEIVRKRAAAKKVEKKGRIAPEKNKEKEVKKVDNIVNVESLALAKKPKNTAAHTSNKGKKRVKITHKLTLEDVKTEDISTLEEERIVQELERERLKEQKKIKSKNVVKKEKKENKQQVQIKKKEGLVELPEVISVKEFAEKTGIQVPQIIGELMKNGIMATINQQVDFDTAALVAAELGVEVKKEIADISSEDFLEGDLAKLLKDEPENLSTRPPIVTVMGHVDHGKTQLLDTIRNADVVAGESGGITQHIGAYQIVYNKKKITFIDTPGHESFTAMRARGAKVTDIAILVVAADEGMKMQTIEAMNHAKDAGVPIIVAINKIDKENANIDRVKGELAEHDLTPEDWGGKTICVPVSALKNENIDKLLEMVLLVAELEDLKGNASRPAVGSVIESHLDPSLGPVATIIINTGTLKPMNTVIVGETSGRIKLMQNAKGDRVGKAGPSDPVLIAGLSEVPHAGDVLQATKNEKDSKEKLAAISELREARKESKGGVIMHEIISRIQAGKMKTLKVVLKADTKGSLEAIQGALAKIESTRVLPKVIHSAVGGVSESDVMMAAASQGVVIGFHVAANAHVNRMAEQEGVSIKLYDVIYDLTQNIEKLLTGLIEAEIRETVTGHAEILEIFFSKKGNYIVGCNVTDGTVEAESKIRIMRGEEKIGEATMKSLKIVKQNIKEVEAGNQCGISLSSNVKLEPGDVFECYKVEEYMPEL